MAECGCALTLGNLGGFDSDDECHVYDNDRKIMVCMLRCPQGRFAVQHPISLKGLSCACAWCTARLLARTPPPANNELALTFAAARQHDNS